jgi:hypothetical protein
MTNDMTWWMRGEGRHGGDDPPPLAAQETEQGGDTPDVGRPPDRNVPDTGSDESELDDGSGAPPFTGEDLDAPAQRKRRPPQQDQLL